MKITKLGWFAELPHGDKQHGDRIREHVGEIPVDERTRVADYLDSGVILAETMGTITHDELADSKPAIGPLCTLTDGTLVWPSDLGHYVRLYGVGVGPQATAIMASNKWTMPQLSPQQLNSVDDTLTDS